MTPAGLTEIAEYGSVLGLTKAWFHLSDEAGSAEAATLIRKVHERGLQLHIWTFRNENRFLPEDLRAGQSSDIAFPRRWGNALAEYQLHFRLHVDGVFTDFPATARHALEVYKKANVCR